ncbi:MAG: ABC transporter ATP-binding protein [Dongiaceae bacterium]
MSRVEIANLCKHYDSVTALDDVSIAFEDGEFFGLLGPSGSGKTTLLRALAGFVVPDSGSIRFDGQRVENVPVHRREIGMVFQNYALFPHLTVNENIAFGLSVRGRPREETATRVDAMLALVRLEGLGERKPRQLSGGQQQRVALARALVTDPKVLLLDEPLGALDRRLRQEMQVELREIQRSTGITAVFVTHDQEEALTLSDRIAIIDRGRLIQIGPPREVYERPETVFAAQFLGDANLFRGTAEGDRLRLGGGQVLRTAGRSDGIVVVRPEKIGVYPAGTTPTTDNCLDGEILQAIFSGASVTYRVRVPALGEIPLLAFLQNQAGDVLAPGARVSLVWSAAHTVPVAP